MRRTVVALAVVALAVVALGCSEGLNRRGAARYDRAALSAALDDPTSNAGHVIGMFALSANGVVDGDTVKVDGLDASLRLLAIDTEETFKHDKALRAYEGMPFPEYLESMRGSSGKPPKGPTPLGMDAKHFAEDFFKGVNVVRLERDHPKEIRGRYNRFLAYVFVEKDGEWINYNIECVRAGMSPYFTKYGYSRRFHDEFSRAQDEARERGVGIWEQGTEHYDDYDDRLAWWNSRAEFAAKFEEQAAGKADHIVLTNWDAMTRLADMRGEWVKVLATVGSVKERKGRAPTRIALSRRLFEDFPVISFDDEVVEASGVSTSLGEFVVVTGRVSRYTYKGRSKRKAPETQLQIELKDADQVLTSPGWTAIAAAKSAASSTVESAPAPVEA
ncbi:MAG: thermonuclease family protein, partial [Nannocystaceae bacterium]|nr:thermonuclease family protein [Nannocystaceae bacterium]